MCSDAELAILNGDRDPLERYRPTLSSHDVQRILVNAGRHELDARACSVEKDAAAGPDGERLFRTFFGLVRHHAVAFAGSTTLITHSFPHPWHFTILRPSVADPTLSTSMP